MKFVESGTAFACMARCVESDDEYLCGLVRKSRDGYYLFYPESMRPLTAADMGQISRRLARLNLETQLGKSGG